MGAQIVPPTHLNGRHPRTAKRPTVWRAAWRAARGVKPTPTCPCRTHRTRFPRRVSRSPQQIADAPSVARGRSSPQRSSPLALLPPHHAPAPPTPARCRPPTRGSPPPPPIIHGARVPRSPPTPSRTASVRAAAARAHVRPRRRPLANPGLRDAPAPDRRPAPVVARPHHGLCQPSVTPRCGGLCRCRCGRSAAAAAPPRTHPLGASEFGGDGRRRCRTPPP